MKLDTVRVILTLNGCCTRIAFRSMSVTSKLTSRAGSGLDWVVGGGDCTRAGPMEAGRFLKGEPGRELGPGELGRDGVVGVVVL